MSALGLAAAAFAGIHLHPSPIGVGRTLPASDAPTAEPTASSTPSPTPASTVAVSFLHDGTVASTGSWWSVTVGANAIPNVVDGAAVPASNDPTTGVRDLTARLEALPALQGHIVLQAGAVNLRAGAEPSAVANQLTVLWQGIQDRGGIPVAVLLPPSNDDASQITALNAAIVAAAQASDIGVLDLHSSVATPAGLWASGLSDDGDIANAAGSSALAAAAEAQLPALLATR
ncbi:hypothetical protein ITJ38_01300 [Agreia pratensis]|uniref:GDSL-type esterase/lipase family protein n=1 Tax=Agreia pratensis TaxID=150121 RepID=UPI00188C6F08|nr:GDSL-type esterase/lipase family protein [Agreia pratensis]MBF4633033.1 hypothetical protein [Agreia pratensis]